MSVMDEGIIDFAGLEKNNKLVLSIFDHLVWGEEEDDVHLLKGKMELFLGVQKA